MKRFTSTALLFLAVHMAVAAEETALTGDRIDELTPEQHKVAEETMAFMEGAEKSFWATLHGLDPSMQSDEPMVSELYTAVIDTFMETLEKRAQQPYTQADMDKQDFMRRRWLEDQLFWDVLAKNFVSYEAWSAVHAPPVVKY